MLNPHAQQIIFLTGHEIQSDLQERKQTTSISPFPSPFTSIIALKSCTDLAMKLYCSPSQITSFIFPFVPSYKSRTSHTSVRSCFPVKSTKAVISIYYFSERIIAIVWKNVLAARDCSLARIGVHFTSFLTFSCNKIFLCNRQAFGIRLL